MKKHTKGTGPSTGETIGIDLGDKVSCYCVFDASGEVIEEGLVRNQQAALARHFGPLPRTMIAGGQSGWISQLLETMDHGIGRLSVPPTWRRILGVWERCWEQSLTWFRLFGEAVNLT